MRKIDIHCHALAFPELMPPRFNFNCERFITPEEQLQINDELDIELAVLLPIVAPEAQWCTMSNENCKLIVDRYPDRFTWFCNVDPRQGGYNAQTDLGKVLNFYKELGAKGLGELTTTLYADDPMMDNLFYHCAQLQMPVLIHIAPQLGDTYGIVDELGLPRIEKMLKKHPDMQLIGHSAAFWGEISSDLTQPMRNDYPTGKIKEGRVPQLMREYGNLYGDISAGSGCNALTRDPEYAAAFLTEFQDRLYYGNDFCIASNKGQYELTYFLDKLVADGMISQEVYEKIIRKNAVKLLGLSE